MHHLMFALPLCSLLCCFWARGGGRGGDHTMLLYSVLLPLPPLGFAEQGLQYPLPSSLARRRACSVDVVVRLPTLVSPFLAFRIGGRIVPVWSVCSVAVRIKRKEN